MPDWLPDLVDTNGEWSEVVARLYAIFERDFKRGRPIWKGRQIWWDSRRDANDPYERGFWHLITTVDRQTNDRLPDFRRAERLAWCAAVITHCDDPSVLEWEYREGDGRIRSYLWLRDLDFVVILEKDARCDKTKGTWFEVAMLITAYYVDGEGSRRRLQSKYDRRLCP